VQRLGGALMQNKILQRKEDVHRSSSFYEEMRVTVLKNRREGHGYLTRIKFKFRDARKGRQSGLGGIAENVMTSAN
jgi:hypothetical protein